MGGKRSNIKAEEISILRKICELRETVRYLLETFFSMYMFLQCSIANSNFQTLNVRTCEHSIHHYYFYFPCACVPSNLVLNTK